MDDIVFAGNRALYLILVMSAGCYQKGSFYNILTYPLIPEEKIWTILFLRGIGRCI